MQAFFSISNNQIAYFGKALQSRERIFQSFIFRELCNGAYNRRLGEKFRWFLEYGRKNPLRGITRKKRNRRYPERNIRNFVSTEGETPTLSCIPP